MCVSRWPSSLDLASLQTFFRCDDAFRVNAHGHGQPSISLHAARMVPRRKLAGAVEIVHQMRVVGLSFQASWRVYFEQASSSASHEEHRKTTSVKHQNRISLRLRGAVGLRLGSIRAQRHLSRLQLGAAARHVAISGAARSLPEKMCLPYCVDQHQFICQKLLTKSISINCITFPEVWKSISKQNLETRAKRISNFGFPPCSTEGHALM